MDLSGQQVYNMLFDAFLQGFLLEHGSKSFSRYPLAGYSIDSMREKLRPAFEEWISSSPRIDDEVRQLKVL